MLPSNLFALLSVATTFTLSNALPAPQSLPELHYAQIGERRLNNEHLSTRATKTEYVAYAVAGINQMMTWYDAATGLWQEAWWPSANVVTIPLARILSPTSQSMQFINRETLQV